MAGRVYIFNATKSDIQIHINDNHVGRLVGADAKQHYVPSQLSAERCDDPTTQKALFATTTKLYLQSINGEVCYKVTINPEEFALGDDIQLYIFQHSAQIAGLQSDAVSCVVPQQLTH